MPGLYAGEASLEPEGRACLTVWQQPGRGPEAGGGVALYQSGQEAAHAILYHPGAQNPLRKRAYARFDTP